MAKPNLRRDPFDRDRTFVVTRGFTIHGKRLGPGDPFSKTLVSTRRLRQMYETRLLTMTESTIQQKAAKPPAFDPDKMSDGQLSLFLEDHGIVPRFGASRDWFVDKVRSILSGQRQDPAPALARVRVRA